jgi:hypothetical protein
MTPLQKNFSRRRQRRFAVSRRWWMKAIGTIWIDASCPNLLLSITLGKMLARA